MNTDLYGLPAQTVEEIRIVLAAHPKVEKAVIYGSRAKGNYKPGSDIDLTLHGQGLSHTELLNMMSDLDDLLQPYMIDLSLYRMIDHAGLRDHIQRVGREFYRRQDAKIPEAARPPVPESSD